MSTFPNRVRFSNIVDANSVPDSWDETDTTKSAGFNDLVQMQTPIKDGLELGTNFVIYSESEAILMEFVGGTFLFNFRKLFGDEGVINQNCVVEVENKHFVFGNTDLYVTDGVSRQSICDERVRQFVFTTLNKKNADRCFVQHNDALSEIYFCYQSGDSLVGFPDTARCNKQQSTITRTTAGHSWICLMSAQELKQTLTQLRPMQTQRVLMLPLVVVTMTRKTALIVILLWSAIRIQQMASLQASYGH